jgi:signal transduction histidine kinase/CheY-like chemotaxis protein
MDALTAVLQRLADGLPLPPEVAQWPPALRESLAAMAAQLTGVQARLAALCDPDSPLPEPLPTGQGFAGIAHHLNRVIQREAATRRGQAAISAWLDEMLAGRYSHTFDASVGLLGQDLRRFNQLAARLGELEQTHVRRQRRAEQTAALYAALLGEHDLPELGRRLLAQLCQATGAVTGAFYAPDDNGLYQRLAGHALSQRHAMAPTFRAGEGLLGQAVAEGEPMVLRDIPPDYLPLESALVQGQPRELLLWPLSWLGQPVAAVELASLAPFPPETLDWLRELHEVAAVTLSMASARGTVAALLADARTKNEELRAQQEELRAQGEAMQQLNAALEEKNEAAMRLQAELEEKNEMLTRQQAELEEINVQLEQKQEELQRRKDEAERASRYKSEFLANMSHELRTPLNSLLLLSGHLLENEDSNLSPDQLESLAMTKRDAEDLLTLINNILDLSKIEAGQLRVIREPVEPAAQVRSLATQIEPLARDKGIALQLQDNADAPMRIYSDGQRIAQILKNLIGNAIKFTEHGSVTVELTAVNSPTSLPDGRQITDGVAFHVVDTGPGIAPERLEEIFEAFQQGDGSITRKYGGTGLGLTISRQLARRLGGDILVESTPGHGSRFSLLLPQDGLEHADTAPAAEPAPPRALPAAAAPAESLPLPADNPLDDDRAQCTAGTRSLLVIEDNVAFARILIKQIRKNGFLALARHFRPVGIVLDLVLPDLTGREVLEQLKADPATAAIPVHIVSGRDRDPALLALGVVDFVQKPLSPERLTELLDALTAVRGGAPARLLVVEDDRATQIALTKALNKQAVELRFARTGAEALAMLEREGADGMLLDLGLPDMSGLELLEEMARRGLPPLPLIVHTGRDLAQDEYVALRKYTDNIVLKGEQGSRRLLDEVALLLHGLQARMARPSAPPPTVDDRVLEGHKVLLVDDDVRSAFALNKVLRKHGLSVVLANDGQLALQKLAEQGDIELVLMDIMMPVMDGYEAIRRIRADERFKHLPVIALTAKTMAEDRDKCLAAGADDYLAKPVDIDKLLSLLQLYLSRKPS